MALTRPSQVSARFVLARPRLAFDVVEIPGVEGIKDLRPSSINSSGEVAGSFSLSPSTAHAFLFRAKTGATSRIAADSTDVQVGTGINSSGAVAVSTVTSPGPRARAYRLQGGAEKSIGALTSDRPESGANAINEKGWIAGWSENAGNWQRAVLWDGAALHDLGSLDGTWSMASALNGSGVAVGESRVPGDASPHAAVFSGGTVLDLGSLGATGSAARGINDAGRVVGVTSFGTRACPQTPPVARGPTTGASLRCSSSPYRKYGSLLVPCAAWSSSLGLGPEFADTP